MGMLSPEESWKNLLKLFDGVRIDHFRGLASYWSVPGSALTAKDGHWEKGPGKDFIDMVNSIPGDGFVIAEDLGDISGNEGISVWISKRLRQPSPAT